MSNSAAADYQIAYDMAVYLYGENSQQAKDAMREALTFLNKGKPAPVTPVVQQEKEASWVS
jgi:hypothetical protein